MSAAPDAPVVVCCEFTVLVFTELAVELPLKVVMLTLECEVVVVIDPVLGVTAPPVVVALNVVVTPTIPLGDDDALVVVPVDTTLDEPAAVVVALRATVLVGGTSWQLITVIAGLHK